VNGMQIFLKNAKRTLYNKKNEVRGKQWTSPQYEQTSGRLLRIGTLATLRA
jgi:hypothetical protein